MTDLRLVVDSKKPCELRVDTRMLAQILGQDNLDLESGLLYWPLPATAEDDYLKWLTMHLTSANANKAVAVLAHYLPNGSKERIDTLKNTLLADNPKISDEDITDQCNRLIEDLSYQAYMAYEHRLADQRQAIKE